MERMQGNYNQNALIQLAQELHVTVPYALVALRTWDTASTTEPGRSGAMQDIDYRNLVWFFKTDVLHDMPGNAYAEVKKQKWITELGRTRTMRRVDPATSMEVPELGLHYNIGNIAEVDTDASGSVWGLVNQGNHRVHAFHTLRFRWFPVAVRGQGTLESYSLDWDYPPRPIIYSQARTHGYGIYVPGNPDPRFTILHTGQQAGAPLLDVSRAYNRILDTMNDEGDGRGVVIKRPPSRRRRDGRGGKKRKKRAPKAPGGSRGTGTSDDPIVIDTCVVCNWPLMVPISCRTCDVAVYCGRACRDTHWDAGHDEVCDNIKELPHVEPADDSHQEH